MIAPTAFLFNQEHEMMRKMAYTFIRKEVMPIIAEHDRSHTFPHDLLPKMAAQGFLSVCLPVRYGGAGMDYISLGIVSEALGVWRLLCARDGGRPSGPAQPAHFPVGCRRAGAPARRCPRSGRRRPARVVQKHPAFRFPIPPGPARLSRAGVTARTGADKRWFSPDVMDICRRQTPSDIEHNGRMVKCFLYE